MRVRLLVSLAVAVLVMASVVTSADGYIHFPPATMSKMCKQSTAIRVLTVKKHDKEKGVIVYEVVETLKGKTPDGTKFRHVIGKETKGAKPIFDWVGDGKQAVMFTIEGSDIACGYVFIDKFCYSVDHNKKGDFWLLIRVDPEMAATFHGTAETLQKVTKDLLAGKEVKVPVDESVRPVTLEERRKRAAALNEIMTENRKK
jgi:hypothetical protein